MKTLTPFLCLALVFLAGPAFAQEDDFEKLTDEEKMKRAQALHALKGPGPEHQLLLERVGSWEQTIKLWPTPGAAKPMVIKGTGTSRPILGGRFVILEGVSGEGMYRTEKMSIMGFDRRLGHYTLTAYDTWGTYGVSATGKYDEKTRTLTMSGEDRDPVLGVTQKYDFVFHFTSADEYRLEIIFKDRSHGNEGPFKMVEVISRRVSEEQGER